MTSSPKKGIIRGATVLGSVFLGKEGIVSSKEKQLKDQDEEKSLKALEEFWLQKGIRMGEEEGYKKGWKEGDTKGYQRGLEEGKKQGHSEGKKQGYEEGKGSLEEKQQQELDLRFETVEKVVKEFHEKYDTLYQQLQPEFIAFCLKVCQKILQGELKKPENVASVIEAVLQRGRKLAAGVSTDVYLASEDFQVLGPTLGKIKGSHAYLKEINFYEEETMGQGNVKLETQLGIVCFDLERQIEDLRDNLLR